VEGWGGPPIYFLEEFRIILGCPFLKDEVSIPFLLNTIMIDFLSASSCYRIYIALALPL